MPTLYSAIRVSIADRSDHSPQAQHASYLAFAQAHPEYATHEPFQDLGETLHRASVLNRPQFKALAAKLRPGDGVYFSSVDRACRHCTDIVRVLAWAEQRDITLYFGNMPYLNDPVIGRVVLLILTLLSRLESYFKSIRGREVNAIHKAKGMYANRSAPPGFQRVGKAGFRYNRIDRDELIDIAAVMPHLERHKDQGGWSLREAAVYLEKRYCEREGHPFRNSAFHPWRWWPARVKHARAIYKALCDCGETAETFDNDKFREVTQTQRGELLKKYPMVRGWQA